MGHSTFKCSDIKRCEFLDYQTCAFSIDLWSYSLLWLLQLNGWTHSSKTTTFHQGDITHHMDYVLPWTYSMSLVLPWTYSMSLVLPWTYSMSLVLPWTYSMSLVLPWTYSMSLVLQRAVNFKHYSHFNIDICFMDREITNLLAGLYWLIAKYL